MIFMICDLRFVLHKLVQSKRINDFEETSMSGFSDQEDSL